MANLIENNEIFYTPYEPKVQNRFILQIDGIPSFLCKKVSRPQLDCGEVILDHINIQRKLKGKCKWGDITLTMYDAIVPSGAQAVMEWVRTAHESVTGRDGYADFYKKNFDIFVLGPVGDKIENWKIWGAYIKSVQFGDMDWATETPVEIALTIAIDYAVLEY
jgi:hypothetical protein